jgi:hypothetical protein
MHDGQVDLEAAPPNIYEFDWGELRLPTAAAQKRIVSVARISQDLRKSARPFKGIIFPDVSEFESYMPSHAVRSPPAAAGPRGGTAKSPAVADLPTGARGGRRAVFLLARSRVFVNAGRFRLAQQGCRRQRNSHRLGGYRNHAPPHVSLNSKPQREFSSGKNFVNPKAFDLSPFFHPPMSRVPG